MNMNHIARALVLPNPYRVIISPVKLGSDPQQIATKGFSTDYGSFGCPQQHIKSPKKSEFGKAPKNGKENSHTKLI